jgi:hypothetical protein
VNCTAKDDCSQCRGEVGVGAINVELILELRDVVLSMEQVDEVL